MNESHRSSAFSRPPAIATVLLALVAISLGIWHWSRRVGDATSAASQAPSVLASKDATVEKPTSPDSGRQQHEGALLESHSVTDDDRLQAYRSTSATSALEHARRLPIDDAGRAAILLTVANICRSTETSSRDEFIATAIEQTLTPDTERHRQLLRLRWNQLTRYCEGIVSSQVRLEAEQAIAARGERAERIIAGRQQIESSELALLDHEALILVLNQEEPPSTDGEGGAVDDAGVEDALWSTMLKPINPELAFQAGAILAEEGKGPFSAVRKLIPLDPADTRLWDTTASTAIYHGGSRPSSRETKIWEASVEVFVCRTAAVCGPLTARGLMRRPVSELQLSLGAEGYWRSTLSEIEWNAVEEVVRQLGVRRQAHPRG